MNAVVSKTLILLHKKSIVEILKAPEETNRYLDSKVPSIRIFHVDVHGVKQPLIFFTSLADGTFEAEE